MAIARSMRPCQNPSQNSNPLIAAPASCNWVIVIPRQKALTDFLRFSANLNYITFDAVNFKNLRITIVLDRAREDASTRKVFLRFLQLVAAQGNDE